MQATFLMSGMSAKRRPFSYGARHRTYGVCTPTNCCFALAETGRVDGVFVDDAIRIWKYYDQYGNTSGLQYKDIDTIGAMSIHINANRDGNGQLNENWLDYAVRW